MPKRTKFILFSVRGLAGVSLIAWVEFNVVLGSSDAEAGFSASEALPGDVGGGDSRGGDSGGGNTGQLAPPEGTWIVSIDETGDAGVGYRILEDVPVGGPEEVAGRTSKVSGFLELEGASITAMEATVDMTTLDSGLELRDQVVADTYLETAKYPQAIFTVSDPIKLPEGAEGESVDFEVPGELTLHGVTTAVTASGQGQWNSTTIEVVGKVDTTLSAFGVARPDLMGRTARDEVVVEFKLQFIPQSD